MPVMTPVTTYGIIVFHAPGVRLHAEGLGRLLGSFLQAAQRRADTRFVILCPSWSRAELQSFLAEEGIPRQRFIFVAPAAMPFALRALRWCQSLFRSRTRRRHRLLGWYSGGIETFRRLAWAFLESFAADRSPLMTLMRVTTMALALVVMAPVLLLAVIAVMVVKATRRLARKMKSLPLVHSVGRAFSGSRRGSTRPAWFVRLYQAMERSEIEELVRLANRQGEVRAWYVPTAFWPQWTGLDRPHLICLPDIALADAPSGFALQDPGDRFLDTLGRIEQTLTRGTNFSTYSRHIARSVLEQRFGIAAECIAVIPHAAARLDRWVEIRGTPDDAAAARAYAQRLLASALRKSTVPAYTDGFANLDVRFLFYASQFRPSKNVLSLLRVYERLLRRHHLQVKLILTGNPTVMPEIGQFITDHRLQHDVLCLCDLSSAELAACYKLAELAVNPTFSEGGCPFTLTEALSVGTPVVMSRIAVTTEVVTDPQLQQLMLFDPRDLAEMEARILWALGHRDELLAAQLPFYATLAERTWEHVVDEHVMALERAAQASAGARDLRPGTPSVAITSAPMAHHGATE